MNKIIDTIWFMEMGSKSPIGIVLSEDVLTGEKKAYIGTGNGLDADADRKLIAARGARLPIQILEHLLKELKEEK